MTEIDRDSRFGRLDRFDRQILSILAGEARISITDLARRIGLSKSPTQARVKRLEESGTILGYRALFDPIAMGLDHVAFAVRNLPRAAGSRLSGGENHRLADRGVGGVGRRHAEHPDLDAHRNRGPAGAAGRAESHGHLAAAR